MAVNQQKKKKNLQNFYGVRNYAVEFKHDLIKEQYLLQLQKKKNV